MRKIIDGKRYDTQTARYIAAWENTADVRSFSYTRQELYRKKTGEYFIYGESGPAGMYAEASGTNSWSSGWGIDVLTAEEARQWAEKHLTADEYEAEFAVKEDEPDTAAQKIGQAIRDRRDYLSRSQQETAERSGMKQQYLAKVEAGDVDVQISTLSRIAQALDTTPAELLKNI